MSEYLLLKWSTLKGWRVESDAARAALQKYYGDDVSISAMAQRDTADQKNALCALIDAIDGPITNDWTGDEMTKEEARKYVIEYR